MNWIFERLTELKSRIAIVSNDKEYSYENLSVAIEKYFIIIGSKIDAGETVAIISDYSFASVSIFFALLKNKNIIVPIVSNVEKEIVLRLDESGATKKISFTNGMVNIEDISLNTNKEKNIYISQLNKQKKSGLILFSSGISGKPKSMVHDLENLINGYKKSYTKEICTLVFLTFDHIGGIDSLLRQISIGGKLVIPSNRFPDYICGLIEKHKVNVLPTTATFLNLLILDSSYKSHDLSSLKIIAFGAEPMPDSLLKRLIMIFPDIDFQQKFGTSETNAIRIKNKSKDSLYFIIDDKNIEYKVVNNELWLKSKTQILGYLNASMEKFTSDGWFMTGDLIEQTEDGYIKIKGRKSDIINIGGQKVLPQEVESVLFQLDFVDDCSVFGESNSITGQTVVANIVINDKIVSEDAKKEIRKYCKSKLDNYKVPTKIIFVSKTNFNERFKKIR